MRITHQQSNVFVLEQKRLSQIVTWAAAWKGGSCDWINFGRNGWAGAERRMVPSEEVSELLPVNAANEYTFRRPLAAFFGQ
jgi:hypothetical protein